MEDVPKSFPPHAKRAYKGEIFEVWQWDQEMFDGSKHIFEGLRRSDTVSIIAVVGDSIIIEDQEQPGTRQFISPPSGRMDHGEDPLTAAKRELLEETGYSSDDWHLWRQTRPPGKTEWNIYTFIARNCERIQEPRLDAGERITTRLISFDEFIALSDNEEFRGLDLVEQFLRLRLDPTRRDAFKRLLFGDHV